MRGCEMFVSLRYIYNTGLISNNYYLFLMIAVLVVGLERPALQGAKYERAWPLVGFGLR